MENTNSKQYNLNNKNTEISRFKKGDRLVVTVKRVCEEGVYVDYPGICCGCVSARCWGNGEERTVALSKIASGDKLDVEVVAWHHQNGMLSLALHGLNSATSQLRRHSPDKTGSMKRYALNRAGHKCTTRVASAQKPKFKPISPRSTLLFDFANVLGQIEPKYAIDMLESIECDLTAAGYNVLFFIERRAMVWAMRNQESYEDEIRLRDLFSRKERVTVVTGFGSKADLTILQIASFMPDSVCVSCDRFDDYAEAFPGIVGTNRVRAFSVTYTGGTSVLCVDGLTMPIAVRRRETKAVANSVPDCESDADVNGAEGGCEAVFMNVPDDMSQLEEGVPEVTDTMCVGRMDEAKPGEVHQEYIIRRLGKEAKRDPERYFTLADLYSRSMECDRKLVAKYERLGWQHMKVRRESPVRDMRRYVQMQTMGYSSVPHLSASRCKAARMSECARTFCGNARHAS